MASVSWGASPMAKEGIDCTSESADCSHDALRLLVESGTIDFAHVVCPCRECSGMGSLVKAPS